MWQRLYVGIYLKSEKEGAMAYKNMCQTGLWRMMN